MNIKKTNLPAWIVIKEHYDKLGSDLVEYFTVSCLLIVIQNNGFNTTLQQTLINLYSSSNLPENPYFYNFYYIRYPFIARQLLTHEIDFMRFIDVYYNYSLIMMNIGYKRIINTKRF